MTTPAVLHDVTVVRNGRILLSVESFVVNEGERWILLGPNGSGKTTMLSILAGRLWPTSGDVALLGERHGHVDLRQLRQRLGFLSSALAKELRGSLSVFDVVLTGSDGALEPWWKEYDDDERVRAGKLLQDVGAGPLSDQRFGVISDGERARVLLARALMPAPDLLCLDEPAAGLDLGAREQFLGRLRLIFTASEPSGVVVVTHHLEEIPVGATHAALLKAGQIVAQGPIGSVITSKSISDAFDVDVEVHQSASARFSARGL